MAYINFKEEVYKANEQLSKRKANNVSIIEYLKEHQNGLKINYDSKYSFRKIEDRVINNTKVEKEEEFLEIANKIIICAEFINCKFDNIKFKECSFFGCTFNNCEFAGGGVCFENCTFVKVETEKKPSLNVKENLSCHLINCQLYAKFLCSDISYLIIEDCVVYQTDFEMTDMTSVIIKNCEMNKINLIDVDLSGAKIFNTYIVDLEFNDKLKSKIDEKTFFDKIKLRENDYQEYEGIYMMYETIANKFKENNLKNNFGEYYYQCRNIQRKSLKGVAKLFSYIDWIFMGYGERIIAPLYTSILLIIIFAIIYLLIGINSDGDLIKFSLSEIRNISLKSIAIGFNEAITLSVALFVCVGVIKATPIQEAYIVADIEMILGVIMMGIIIATITRKFVR